jgi:hypothetical protein
VEQYQGQPIDLKPFKITFIVCGSLTTIFALMTFVLWFMFQYNTLPSTAPPLAYVVVFSVVAVAAVGGAPFVRASGMRKTGPYTARTGMQLEGEQAAWERIGAVAVVGMALPEISLLLGFVLGYLAMNWLYYIPFAALCLIGWAFMFPRPAQVRAWYAHQMGYDTVPGMVN